MKKIIGTVTPEECEDIKDLFERKNALRELAQVLSPSNKELYEQLLKDTAETSSKFNQWWDTMASKYSWEKAENGNWEIDFNDCSIYLVTEE